MPLELDQIYTSLDDLTVALGPNGANKNGALTDLLETTAENFGGQGAQFHQTIEDFGKLSETLDDNKEELFGSARELEGFISTLADERPDGAPVQRVALRGLRRCSPASGRSCPRRCENLSIALGEVSTFVKENREILGRNITGLNRVAKVLVKQRDALDEILDSTRRWRSTTWR